eukprot:GHVP01021680.1.p1 GENE.GHVP01021680.1~~GHVP01021680.1.p1  ORF type:complete len:136 (-),score=25.73 GHVP01021680.1:86-469(-)
MDLEEKIELEKTNLEFFSGGQSLGKGQLIISTKNIRWIRNDDQAKEEKTIEYLQLALHAISRGGERFPKDCIYCQISTKEDLVAEDGTDKELDDIPLREIRLVPEDSESIHEIFKAIQEMTRLHQVR